MTSSAAFDSPPSAVAVSRPRLAHTLLRAGAALCFLGHGAFGIMTKAAWLPYFAVAGIPAAAAWRMMPMIGVIDIAAALTVVFAPRRLAVFYMVLWGTWTAMLRPLAGESLFEAVERAGNYGVPLALLVLSGGPLFGSWRRLVAPLGQAVHDARTSALVCAILRWTTVFLLAGHGALGIAGKATLIRHYTAIGLPGGATAIVIGAFELVLAVWIALHPSPGVLVFVAVWKIAAESLFLVAGSPIWEVLERGGSYAAPLALAVLLFDARGTRLSDISARE